MFVIIGSADWRMMLPLAGWLVLYALLLRYFRAEAWQRQQSKPTPVLE